jgi:hypothetical protein
MSVPEAIPVVRLDIFHVANILLAVNANFYERVACLEEKEKRQSPQML